MGSLLYKISESLSEDVRHNFSLEEQAYMAQRDAILELAAKGPCVIVGRGACEVLRNRRSVLRTYIYADLDTRIRRTVEEYHESPENIEKRIRQIDKKRMAYYHFYEKKEILWTEHFDLCINSGKLGLDQTVRFICDAYRG